MNPVYSVVIPCYNEEEVITESYRRLTDSLLLLNERYELIFINDGSKDKTSEMLDELADEDTHVRVIHFARNAGHQIEDSAGLD